MKRQTLIGMVVVFWSNVATAMQCPTDYHVSGSYCIPNANASPGPAIPKVGSCPTDYHPSGDFCLGSRNAAPAVVRMGSCPVGYNPSGDYCLANR